MLSSKLHIKHFQLTSKAFWLYSPISILAFPVSLLVSNPGSSILVLTFTGIVITLGAYLIYMLLTNLLNLLRSENVILRLITLLIVSATTGAIRGILFFEAVKILNLAEPSNFTNRIYSSIFTTLFWLPLANYVINISDEFKYRYQSALRIFLQRNSLNSNISQNNLVQLGNLELNLKQSVEGYLGKSDSETFRKLSSTLVQQINEEIRPLSQRIWIQNLAQFPAVKYGQLLKDSIKLLDYSKTKFYLAISALALLSNFSLRSFTESIWRCATFLVAIFVIQKIYEIFIEQESIGSKNVLFLVSIGLVPVYLSEYLAIYAGYSGDWLATTLITPVAPAVIIILSLTRLAQKDRDDIVNMLEQSSNKNLSEPLSANNHEGSSLASYLHNTLQSELLALSKQLEDAAENNNPVKSAELLKKVSDLVNRSMVEDFEKYSKLPLQRLESVISSWNGILNIDVQIDEVHFQDDRRNGIIVQTIEEVATNVWRHDKASELQISAQKNGSNLKLIFQSNGKEKLKTTKGVGSAWLDQIAVTPWSIEKNSIGTLLIIEI